MNPLSLLYPTTKGDYIIFAAEIKDRHIKFYDHDHHNGECIPNHHTEEYVADGVISRRRDRKMKAWTPPLMIFLATRALAYFEIALTAALKVFGKELGLLLLQDKSRYPIVSNAVLLTHVKRRYGIDRAWNVVQRAFEAIPNYNVLLQFNKKKNTFPFMLAAKSFVLCCDDGDIKLTLLYHLLRKDFSWLESASPSA
ncbi:predicted protein [Chaetoceros tenuissimus]|uniref:Uncharacterized protein n=1 Tax=Chaetoceros tenuissimus TaxID=426638 RepID=A0AAD3H262_9STRA|nr:predicted protein [Chaetoceros tenuissimus]